MGVPNPIANRYKRYKAGTNKLISWLHLLGTPTPAAALESPTINLTTQDLVRLAEKIASATPTVDIPLAIIVVTEDVIEGRQVCAEWYSASTDGSGGETEKQNQGHRNFISVLKKILVLLQNAYNQLPKPSAKAKRGAAAVTKAEIRQNIYDYLDVEEPSATPIGSGPVAKSKSTAFTKKPLGPTQIQIQEVEEADKTFAIWCFFKDQYDVCELLKSTWQQHAAGTTSFAVACELTSSAFLLMKKASEALTAEYPAFADVIAVIEHLDFEVATVAQGLTLLAFREKKVDADALTKPAVHELFSTRAFMIMTEFRNSITGGCRVPPTGQNRTHRFASAMQALVPHLSLLLLYDLTTKHPESDRRYRPFPNDLFVEGLIEAGRTNVVPPWLVTACQAYMHIYDALGQRVAVGHDMLHCDAKRIKQVVVRRRRFVDALDVMSPLQNKDVDILDAHVDFYVKSEAFNTIPGFYNPPTPFILQKLLPVSCGSFVHNLQMGTYTTGVTMCNGGFAVIAAAYLYTAARYSGVLEEPWADMDWFLAFHGAQQAIVLEAKEGPSRFESLAKHFRITLGGKVSKKAQGGSGPVDPRVYQRSVGASHRFLYGTPPPPKTTILSGRKIDARGASTHTQHVISVHKNDPSYITSISQWNDLQEQALYKVANAALNKQAASAGIDRSKSSGARSWKLPPLQLLDAYVDILKDDELSFNFDYLGFTQACHDSLLAPLRDHHAADVGRGYLPYCFVNIMLWELAATEKKRRDEVKMEDTILCQASDHIQQFVRQNGSKYLDEARPRCSTHEPTLGSSPCTDTTSVLGYDNPPLHPEAFNALKELYENRGIDFHADEATNTIMLFNPAWKDYMEMHADLLEAVGADEAAVKAAKSAKSPSAYLFSVGKTPIAQVNDEQAHAWKDAMAGTADLVRQTELMKLAKGLHR